MDTFWGAHSLSRGTSGACRLNRCMDSIALSETLGNGFLPLPHRPPLEDKQVVIWFQPDCQACKFSKPTFPPSPSTHWSSAIQNGVCGPSVSRPLPSWGTRPGSRCIPAADPVISHAQEVDATPDLIKRYEIQMVPRYDLIELDATSESPSDWDPLPRPWLGCTAPAPG